MKNATLYRAAMTELAEERELPTTFDAELEIELQPNSRHVLKPFNGKMRLIAIVEPYKAGYFVNYASDWSGFIYETEEEMIAAINRESRDIDERGFI